MAPSRPISTGVLSDDQIWKIVTFLKHSKKLPGEVQAAWQMAAAAAPGGANQQP
jgi:hypothetical protein